MGLTKVRTGSSLFASSGIAHCIVLVIHPVDFRTAGHIIDDEMHDIMVKPLPMGCRLTVSRLRDVCL